MLCEATRTVAPAPFDIARGRPTQSAVSGSSDAVGSSSSSSSGWLISDFASETRVFCPHGSLPVHGQENRRGRDQPRAFRSAPRHRNPVEPAEDGEILPYRKPRRQIDIGTFEIHPASASALWRRAWHRPAPGCGPRWAAPAPCRRDEDVVPARAIAAQQAGDAAARNPKQHVIDRTRGLVELRPNTTRRNQPDRPRGRCARVVPLSTISARSLGHHRGKRKTLVVRLCLGIHHVFPNSITQEVDGRAL